MALYFALASTVRAQEVAEQIDNGTDPTRFSTSATLAYEYKDLGAIRHGPRAEAIVPFGAQRNFNLRLQVPVVSNDVAGNHGYGLGDVAIRLGHVFGMSRKGGNVLMAEMIFDTASRAELGSGRDVLKASFIRANFLRNGIFAPALVHSVDVGGDRRRAGVDLTTIDFYYVPKFADPRIIMTIDPALNADWENDAKFASLTLTLGRVVGKAFGGNAQVFVKPMAYMGSERPGDWGVEVGYKVIGF